MMQTQKTLDNYIDDAKDALGIRADRELDRSLGNLGAAVYTWKSRKALPSQKAIIALAEKGGNDPRIALQNLQVWGAKGKTLSIWQQVRDKVEKGTILTVLFICSLLIPASPLLAEPLENRVTIERIYYILWQIVKRLLASIRYVFSFKRTGTWLADMLCQRVTAVTPVPRPLSLSSPGAQTVA